MAKDTEKLIRQLSLISFLMAERRPVTALEIKREVEGYSGMNDDAFARRFYADRAELESLGIELKVDKPAEGYYEAENYSLPPENFYLLGDRVHRRGAGRAAHAAVAARRRVRLRGAAAAGAAAAVVGQALAAGRARAPQRGARHHGGRRRPRAVPAAVEDRDGDLPPQDDPVRLLHDGPRRAWSRARSTRTTCSSSTASTTSWAARTSATRARVPPHPHPRQGRLLVEGRARLPAARGLRPAHLRHTQPAGSSATASARRACGSPARSTGT